MSSKPRREYDVYLKSELSLGIACGELMVPPNAEVFTVREVLEGDTEAAAKIAQLRAELESARRFNRKRSEHQHSRIRKLQAEIERLRKLLRRCQPFVARLQPPILDLAVKITEELKKREVSDE